MAYIINTIIDPDDINTSWTAGTGNLNGHYYTDEIHINCVDKTFHFKGDGNMDTSGDGITGQSLYSFFKDRWQDTAAITKFDFPMLSITNEQFEFIDAWIPDDGATTGSQTDFVFADDNPDTITNSGSVDFTDFFKSGDTLDVTETTTNDGIYTIDSVTATVITLVSGDSLSAQSPAACTLTSNVVTQGSFTTTTSKLVRTAGWAEVLADNTVNKRVSGIVSLGTLVDNTDQPYFAQDSAFTAGTDTTEYTGPVNEPIRIFSQVVGDTNISFDGSNAITSAGQRLDVFLVGDVITVTGTTNNNGTFTVTDIVSPYELTTTESGTAEADQSATMVTDLTSYFKMYARERGKIYADSDLPDIGVTTMTYIVYRFPFSNATDLNLETTLDTQIDSNADGTADVSPYDVIAVTYLKNPDTSADDLNIVGAWQSGTTYSLGDVVFDTGDSKGDGDARWYYVDATTGASSGANMNADTGNTWTLWDKASGGGERWVKDGFYAYSIIIDANDTVTSGNTKSDSPYTHASGGDKENIYDWCQWALRQTIEIDSDTTRNGNVADLLTEFVGSTLETITGVFIDDIAPIDTNQVAFNDYSSTSRTYPLVVTVTINFNSNLSDNTTTGNDSVFYAYYKDPDGVDNGNEFGTVGALQVIKSPSGAVGSDVSNIVPVSTTGSSYQFSYAYDSDVTGGRPVSSDTDIVVVAIGLDTGQYVKAEGKITTSGATVSLVAPLERNYSNPA